MLKLELKEDQYLLIMVNQVIRVKFLQALCQHQIYLDQTKDKYQARTFKFKDKDPFRDHLLSQLNKQDRPQVQV